MLNGIKIQNFKCFLNKQSIPLKPLSIICGRNSSGKSSCIQSLLLLKQSLNIKVSLVGSYMAHWREYPLQFLLGSGLGSGLLNERGVSYLLEPTYLELIRYFGLIAFPVILIILVLLPIYYFLKSYGTQQFQKAKYVLVAYLLYIMLEISSNPLLISSTGMIVYVVVLSTAYSCYKIKYYG